MSIDMTATIAAKSDQLNADDLIGGPLIGTVKRVRAGDNEQPIWIDLDSWQQPWKPSKTMRRVLVACWGADGASYVGRSLKLFRNPETKFGGIKVGGIEISHVSHIDKPVEVALAVSRGKKLIYRIDILQRKSEQPDPAAFHEMKAEWKAMREKAGESVDAEEFRVYISEATAGRIAMADAMIPAKYEASTIEWLREDIKRIGAMK